MRVKISISMTQKQLYKRQTEWESCSFNYAEKGICNSDMGRYCVVGELRCTHIDLIRILVNGNRSTYDVIAIAEQIANSLLSGIVQQKMMLCWTIFSIKLFFTRRNASSEMVERMYDCTPTLMLPIALRMAPFVCLYCVVPSLSLGVTNGCSRL